MRLLRVASFAARRLLGRPIFLREE